MTAPTLPPRSRAARAADIVAFAASLSEARGLGSRTPRAREVARVEARPSSGNRHDPGAIRSALPQGSRREGLSVARGESRGGQVTSNPEAALSALRAEVFALRDDLNDGEMRELDVLTFGYHRERDRRAQARALRVMGRAVMRMREPALIASMGASDIPVQGWEGVIGLEGQLTGDGRLIEFGALTFASFPMPLRYAPIDHGGHDGAILVGRIDAIERRDDGSIYARGVLDLGSELGREAVRLIRAGMLGGVSMDLDNNTAVNALVDGQRAKVTSDARVRAATVVAIPAFEEARIALTDDALVPLTLATDPDCGCEPTAPGVHTFINPAA